MNVAHSDISSDRQVDIEAAINIGLESIRYLTH
jgi:hypothetical protein